MIACCATIARGLLTQRKLRWCASAAAVALLAAHGAWANTKFQAPAAHPAAPHFGGAPGGGAHMPGGMGGVHMPGNMNGAHMPGSMGGAHIPGSMGGAHIPGGEARQAESARRPEGEHGTSGHAESHAHAEPHRSQEVSHHEARGEAHGGAQHEARAGEHGEHAGEHGGEHHGEHGGEHSDPRIGGRASMHTRLAAGVAVGAGAALAAHHFGGGSGHDAGHDFRARPADRDIGRDRAFAAAHAHDFHARYVRDFTPAEYGRWRGGLWSAGWHFGRFGWWWDVDGVWYPYAVPVYPFPLEVSALTVYGDEYVEVPALAAEVAIPPLPAAPSAVYSCASPSGYYPAVAACRQPWQMADTAPALMPN